MKRKVYFDYQATTPVAPEVLEVMLPYFSDKFGNAASNHHRFGLEAQVAVEKAREQVALLIGAKPNEVIFTSGATESNHLALLGTLQKYKEAHVITVKTEHESILGPLHKFQKEEGKVTFLPVDSLGKFLFNEYESSFNTETKLVTVMAANNEIGVIHPLKEIAKIAHSKGALFHSDATQAMGKIPLNVLQSEIDLLSLSAHKMYGPKGTGALYVKEGCSLKAQFVGGGHERGLRSGTLNVPGIVGFGAACQLMMKQQSEEFKRLLGLRNKLLNTLQERFPFVCVNGELEERLSHNLNLCFKGILADELLMNLPDIALSKGSACASSAAKSSHVLMALGLSLEDVSSSVRFSLGLFTTEEEIDYVIARVSDEIVKIRSNKS